MIFQALPLIAQAHEVAGLSITAAVLLIAAILFSVFWIWTMVDCLSSSMPTGEKVMWFFLILFLHAIGAIVYVLIARRPHERRVVT